jgi:hypothetical protein
MPEDWECPENGVLALQHVEHRHGDEKRDDHSNEPNHEQSFPASSHKRRLSNRCGVLSS